MPLNLGVPEFTELKPRIAVIGVGGAGGNAVNNMIDSQLEGVEFIVANTDAQALGLSKSVRRIQLGAKTTQGLGAGSLPEVGRAAAEESLEEIFQHVGPAHMLFITAGMGGGTGTGAAPVIAQAAKERGILTVGVVTKPFHFEGQRRMRVAAAGIEALQGHVDTLLIIPNQNLFSIANERTTFHEAFAMADQVLHSGVRGITDLMVMPGLINLDFNDVKTVMGEMGKAMMGTGEAEGDKRAIRAAEAAISNPLLDDVSMKGARGVLINITGSMDMTLFEVDEAANRIRAEVDPEANIIVGSTFNQDLSGRVRVSVVATGIDSVTREMSKPVETVKTQVPVSKPWREPAVTVHTGTVAYTPHAPAAPPPQPAPQAPPPRAAAEQQNLAMEPAPVAATPPPLPTQQANPVGDVHERIRRMLTEGADLPPPRRAPEPPPPAVRPQAEHPLRAGDAGRAAPRNPFRQTDAGRSSIGAALDMIRNLGAPPKEAPRAPTTQAAPTRQAPQPRGDLFDDQTDAELDIPSFLRKKKTG
jgi:cell division protein FtsZ